VRRTVLPLTVAATALLLPTAALAFSYESPVSDGCHEMITQAALRRARQLVPALAQWEPISEEDSILLRDLPFRLDDDLRDLPAAALLIGVRDNDLKGLKGIDSSSLAAIHGRPSGQREHCLRTSEQDGPEGARKAIEDCRDLILTLVDSALSRGLDLTTGRPDLGQRTVLRVALTFSGNAKIELPIFYLYLGQALHVLQDSFTHAYRDPKDHLTIHTVLNWVDVVNGELDEGRDGPAHLVALDQCVGTDEILANRRAVATEASVRLLMAVLDDDIGQRRAKVEEVLADYMTVKREDCTLSNRWCDSFENGYQLGACSCRSTGSNRSSVVVGALLLALLAFRRRALPLLFLLVATSAAAAEPEAADSAPSETPLERRLICAPGRQLACACPSGAQGAQVCSDDGGRYGPCLGCEAQKAVEAERAAPATVERPREELLLDAQTSTPFGLHAAFGGALDNTAIALSVGLRYRLTQSWLLGIDAELNPWASLEAQRFSLGVLNLYGTAIRRWEISDWVALRTSAHLGTSVLLTELVGARSGTAGLYIGLNLIGLEFELSPRWSLIIDPADVSIPIPNLTGAPLSYRQYRFTVALQLDASRPRPLLDKSAR
jgi:hypothetical protein